MLRKKHSKTLKVFTVGDGRVGDFIFFPFVYIFQFL